MTTSPAQRSLAYLRDQGYQTIAIVEHWNQYAGIRQDLFGFIDILALKGGETLAVQATTGTNVAARVDKIANSPHVAAVRQAGWTIVVHGWRKSAKSKRWELRTVDVS